MQVITEIKNKSVSENKQTKPYSTFLVTMYKMRSQLFCKSNQERAGCNLKRKRDE